MLFTLRKIQEKDYDINIFLKKKYSNYDIRYSNVGFVIIPEGENYVIKYYMSDNYIKDKILDNIEYNTFSKEKNNYIFFSNNNILLPKYLGDGEEKIGNYIFNYIIFENIRIKNKKIFNFSEIDTLKFSNFIKKIHSLKKGYILGSIHTSDFFINDDGDIGIFDLVTYYKGFIEVDLSRIIYGYNFDLNFIKRFLLNYGIEKIDKYKLIKEIYNLSKLNEYNKKNFFKVIYFIKNM